MKGVFMNISNPQKGNKTLYKNYAFNSIYQLLILIIPLFLTPFITRVLGPENIGQYSFTRSIVTYFVLFGTVGSNMYAQREIAYAGSNEQKRSLVFWEILAIRCILLGISLIAYLYFAVYKGRYPLLFLIQVSDIVAAMVDVTWYFQGTEKFGVITLRNAVMKIASAVLIIATVHAPDDLWIYVLIYSGGSLVGQLWMWKDIVGNITSVSAHQICLQRHLKGIAQLFIPQVAIQVYLVIDKTMIELLTGDSAQTGYYELAQTVQRTGVTIVTAFGTVAASRIAALKSTQDSKAISGLLTQSYELVCLTAVPIALGIGAIAQNFIPWFLGNGYIPVIQLLILLCPLIIIIGFSNISGIQYMVPMGLQNQMTASTLIGAAVNVFLNLLWIPKYGAVGAAIASIISECVVMLIQGFCIRNVIIKTDVMKSFCQAILSGSIMVLAVKMTERTWLGASTFTNTLILIVEGCIVYVGLQLAFKNRILRKLLKKFSFNRYSD